MTVSAKLALHDLPPECTASTDEIVSSEKGDSLARKRFQQGQLLTVEEVAALLRVPPSWVYDRTRLRTNQRIPGFRLGKYWRFRETDVLAWLERQRGG
jgi:excisionase family DNA binding protein